MKRLFQTLKLYMEGKLTFRQESSFREWLSSEEGKATFSGWVESSYLENDSEEIHPDWREEELLNRILEKKRKTDYPIHRARSLNTGPWTLNVAATVLILFFLGHIWHSQNLKSEPIEASPEIPVLITKQNPKGQKSRIILPDSSIVFLNADSKLSYWQDFAKGREVELVGEAFFEVRSDSLNPFVVNSPRLTSTALGTSFNISAYPAHPVESVTLATGKILVASSSAAQSVLLNPGEGTIYREKSEKLTKTFIDADLSALWTKGILHFDKVPWSEVILLLERWYGVNIRVSGSWNDPLCSGSFRQNEYLNNVLQVLGHSIGFSHSIDGKNVNIHLKP